MLFLLPWDSPGQFIELIQRAINPPPRLFTLLGIHLYSGAAHTPAGPLANLHNHLQVAQQLGHYRWRCLLLDLPARFQIQLWLSQNPISDQG